MAYGRYLSARRILENETIRIKAGSVTLNGNLHVPRNAKGIVIFVHGGGSSRLSPGNRFLAKELNMRGIATLLLDLLTPSEELWDRQTRQINLRSAIGLLSERLVDATDWVTNSELTRNLGIGYLGMGTGTAAALVSASRRPFAVRAVVSRSGRADLAMTKLDNVRCPTLLIVGGRDVEMLRLNRYAYGQLRCKKQLIIMQGAGHLSGEKGGLRKAALHAAGWFLENLGSNKMKIGYKLPEN